MRAKTKYKTVEDARAFIVGSSIIRVTVLLRYFQVLVVT